MNNIALGILIVLHECGEIRGTEELARKVLAHKRHVRKNAITLAALGMIDIQPGNGRGHKTIFRDAGALKNFKGETRS